MNVLIFGLPSCVFICALKLQASANLFLQSSQPWGLSPENGKENVISKTLSINFYSTYHCAETDDSLSLFVLRSRGSKLSI